MPDLIILDLLMPGVPEWRILELLKTDQQTAPIPVLVCSAAKETILRAEARLRAHGCDILFKPFRIEELFEKLERLLG